MNQPKYAIDMNQITCRNFKIGETIRNGYLLTLRRRHRELTNGMGLSEGVQKHLAMWKMQFALQK